jgi:hypothetical protein
MPEMEGSAGHRPLVQSAMQPRSKRAYSNSESLGQGKRATIANLERMAQLIVKFDVMIDSHCPIDGCMNLRRRKSLLECIMFSIGYELTRRAGPKSMSFKQCASNLIRRDDPIRILFGSHEISERFVTQVSDQPDGL